MLVCILYFCWMFICSNFYMTLLNCGVINLNYFFFYKSFHVADYSSLFWLGYLSSLFIPICVFKAVFQGRQAHISPYLWQGTNNRPKLDTMYKVQIQWKSNTVNSWLFLGLLTQGVWMRGYLQEQKQLKD